MLISTFTQLSVMVLAPLVGCLIAGFARRQIGRVGAHSVTIAGMLLAFGLACNLLHQVIFTHTGIGEYNWYTWAWSGQLKFAVGFLLDPLSVMMVWIVTFVSLLVHIYSMGYMRDDEGYQRFFSYISLFTFAMLMLVTANNLMQLFFGWEGVGLASYLLIGFWYQRDSAVAGSLKAFLVNRVGDFGFVLGIGLVLATFGSLNYAEIFSQVNSHLGNTITLWSHHSWSTLTVICLLLFVGAMAKSAQVPLHVWLPESMEGPTPISALIHAATMVTAGIYMVARMSPLYEHSAVALNVLLVIGATGALFLGLVGVVQNDIKRVVAYSTLSQLGYMVVGLGASAYAVSIFHLFTHACFKALLFLGAGSVIIAMHHEQDMRHMGGLRKYMPITYITFVIGTLALCGFPPFAGFYSKDLLIEAVHASHLPGAAYAYWCVLLGVFVTALYSFRALLMTFHGVERMPLATREHLHESPFSVTLPLIVLAIPSLLFGFYLITPLVMSDSSWFGQAITVLPAHPGLAQLRAEFVSPTAMALAALHSVPFWLAVAGAVSGCVAYQWLTGIPAKLAHRFNWIYQVLLAKYGFDWFNERVLVNNAQGVGRLLYRTGDLSIIDGIVNGVGYLARFCAGVLRSLQSGYLYHYALAMMIGVLGFLCWLKLVWI